MFDENEEFLDEEPPSFVAAAAKAEVAPQRKIGVSAGAGNPAPVGLIDSGGRIGDVSSITEKVGALKVGSATKYAPASQNIAQEPQDDVFDFDPGFQEDPNEPFTESDLDEDDEDENSFAEDEGRGRGSTSSSSGGQAATLFSTSVPINVPQINNYQRHRRALDLDDPDVGGAAPKGCGGAQGDSGSGPMNPDDMAASIQALARSLHADKSELVFGELPKSRTHISRTLSNQPGAVVSSRRSRDDDDDDKRNDDDDYNDNVAVGITSRCKSKD